MNHEERQAEKKELEEELRRKERKRMRRLT
jgi:hypothetical protein